MEEFASKRESDWKKSSFSIENKKGMRNILGWKSTVRLNRVKVSEKFRQKIEGQKYMKSSDRKLKVNLPGWVVTVDTLNKWNQMNRVD